MFRRIIDHPFFVFGLLALPLFMVFSLYQSFEPMRPGATVEHALLHPTGETSVRLLIITMILTPMRRIFPQSGFWQWMMKRRRYFGVAAFAYAALHLTFFVMDEGSVIEILGSFTKPAMLLGWFAFFVFLPLAITSNDWSVRKLGLRWKRVQQWVYPAAVATAVHWVLVSEEIGPALVHFLPLVLLEAYRLYGNWRRQRARLAS